MSKDFIRNSEWARFLIEEYLAINQINILQEKFDIKLDLIFKGKYMDVAEWCKKRGILSPSYANGNEFWYNGNPLNYGSLCGWDVTVDGEFALCRVQYEDYRLFKVIKAIKDGKPHDENIQNNSNEIKELRKEIKEIRTIQEEILNLLRSK